MDVDVVAPRLETPSLLSQFEGFKAQIDAHHARRERLIKASRDVTALSKKVIFALHRVPISSDAVAGDRSTIGVLPKRIEADIAVLNAQIRALFDVIRQDLAAADDPTASYRYARQVSPGLQEFIESFSLHVFIAPQSAVAALPEAVRAAAVQELAATTSTSDGGLQRTGDVNGGAFASHELCKLACAPLELSEQDYLLGNADLSGELGRRAIAALSSAGGGTGSTDTATSDAAAQTTAASAVDGARRVPPAADAIRLTLRDMLRMYDLLDGAGRPTSSSEDDSRSANTSGLVAAATAATSTAASHGAGIVRTDTPTSGVRQPSAGAASTPFSRELGKKIDVMRASVKKVETAVFDYVIRGRERLQAAPAPSADS